MVDLSNFWVITPHFNSVQHKTRVRNYERFSRMCKAAGVNLLTIEVAFGDRPFEVTEKGNPNHVQLRSYEEFWLKENILRVGVNYLMQWKPEMLSNDGIIAWVDSDCAPDCEPRDWFEMTKLSLDHYKIVQMFEWLVDLGPEYQWTNGPHRGFMASYEEYGRQIPKLKDEHGNELPPEYGHAPMGGSGLAWACNVSTYSELGGFLEVCPLGSSDWYMALGLLGLADNGYADIKELRGYGKQILRWQKRAQRYVKRDVGFVRMTCKHYFHGVKEHRFYGSRDQILRHFKFNPDTDLKYDAQGLLQLEVATKRQIAMRDAFRMYMHSKNEDSIALRDMTPQWAKLLA